MDVTQDIATYLESQTRKMNGVKELLYYRYISGWTTIPNFLRKPMPCKIFNFFCNF